MNKTKFFSAFIIILASVFYIGCGDDSVPNNGGGTGGTPPNINMKKGAVFTFTVDTLNRFNGTPTTINMTATDTYIDTNRIGANLVHTILSRTDSAGIISFDTNLVYYDAAGGKFYHFGITRLFNLAISPTWDLVADFALAIGTSWNIPLNPNTIVIGVTTIFVSLNAKVAEQTTFQTTSNPPRELPCYRVEIKADLSVSGIPTPIASIFFDYYIGYNNGTTNASGIARLKLRPVNIPPLNYSNFGVDRVAETFSIP